MAIENLLSVAGIRLPDPDAGALASQASFAGYCKVRNAGQCEARLKL
jgi:hypothetical protein